MKDLWEQTGEAPEWMNEHDKYYYPRMATPPKEPPPAQQTPAAQIAAILREHGVAWVGEIRECKDIRKRPGAQPSWCIELAPGARIPPAVWARLQPGCWRSGNLYVVQMKGS